jgi:transcriptional regulator with XRE-family HTH domain
MGTQTENIIDAISKIAKEQNISQSEIARRTGYKQQSINRLFSKRYTPKLDFVLNILNAIDCEFEIKHK